MVSLTQIRAVYQSHCAIGCFHLPGPDPLTSFHWNSTNSLWRASSIPPESSQYDSPQWHEYLLQVWKLCRFSRTQAFHMGDWKPPHVLCHGGPIIQFLGGCSHEACTDTHPTNKCTNPTELCRPCDASAKQDRGGCACLRLRTASVSLLLHAGWQVVWTSNIMDVCLTEAANRATVEHPLKDVCQPYVGCDVFNIGFSSPADTGTLLGQAYFLLFNSVVNIRIP